MAKDGSRSEGARRGDRAEGWYSRRREPRGTYGGAGRGKVGLAAEKQLAIALSRRSVIRWFERTWRNGERPTESSEFRRGREGGEG